MWAYVEQSDEDKNHLVILGGKEFPTQEEAEDWSKGFDPFSYEHVDPKELKIKKLTDEITRLKKRLSEAENELLSIPK